MKLFRSWLLLPCLAALGACAAPAEKPELVTGPPVKPDTTWDVKTHRSSAPVTEVKPDRPNQTWAVPTDKAATPK